MSSVTTASPTGLWENALQKAEQVLEAVKEDVEAVAETVVPFAEEFLSQFKQTFMNDAIELVVTAAQGEMAALAGSEKQSYVVTQLMEKAQVQYGGLVTGLRSAALTTAQEAYNAVAVKLKSMIGS